MSDHLSDKDIERYRDRLMSPVEALAANDHLELCDQCYRRSGGEDDLVYAYHVAQSKLLSADVVSSDHLVYEQIAAYVDGELNIDARKALESHVEICGKCDIDLRELVSLKASLKPEREFGPQLSRRLRPKLNDLRHSRAIRLALQVAGIALAATLCAWIVTRPLRAEIGKTRSVIQEQLATLERVQSELNAVQAQNAELAQALEASATELREVHDRLSEAGISTRTMNVSLNDSGGVVTLDVNGRLSGLESSSPTEEKLVKTVLATGRLRTPALMASLGGPQRSLMGSSTTEPYPLLSPVGIVIATDRPTLKWRRVDGATGYIASVYDLRMNEMAVSSQIQDTEWTLSKPLKRGHIYTWQVRVIKEGVEIRLPSPAARDARFKVLERSTVEAVERAKQTHPDSHLLLGILYANAGLFDDAERELNTLAQSNRRSSLVERLLGSLRSAKGR